jgi:signal transduction histidine kinase
MAMNLHILNQAGAGHPAVPRCGAAAGPSCWLRSTLWLVGAAGAVGWLLAFQGVTASEGCFEGRDRIESRAVLRGLSDRVTASEVWSQHLALARIPVGVFILLVIAGLVQRRLRELRWHYQYEAEAACARERERIAQDLHDGLGAHLTELRFLSGGAGQQSLSPHEVNRRFQQLAECTEAALEALRNAIWTTHPKADTLHATVSHVCEQAQNTIESADLRCRLELPADLPDLIWGPDLRRELLLACNEAVHNAVRHAHAGEIRLRFSIEPHYLVVRVEDDGCGFDPGLNRSAEGSHGFGLESLRRRMSVIGGQCEIHTGLGCGTAVVLRPPLEPLPAAPSHLRCAPRATESR